jgi:hypothetical protein
LITRRQASKRGPTEMLRTAFAFAIAGLILAGMSGTVRAAPILPLPSATTAGLDNVVDVQWRRRCWRDRWGRVHCRGGWWGRHCWRDRWGHRHCRW